MYVQVYAKRESGNTCIYLCIQTIPIHTDISAHTCTYLYIHAILAIPICVMDGRKILTAVTYIRDSCRYMHILLYTCRYPPPPPQIPTTYSYLHVKYLQIDMLTLKLSAVCGRYLQVCYRLVQVSGKYL
jgi:hypothetical protein